MSAQNIDCGYLLEPPQRGGSNEYPQSMFFSRNKATIVYPVNPFYFIKMGFMEVKGTMHMGMFSRCVYASSLQSVFCPHNVTLYPTLFKMRYSD